MSEVQDALAGMAEEERKYVLVRSYPLFCAYYLGWTMSDYQGEMIAHSEANRRSLALIPAGHTKSSSFAFANIIRHICWNPNIRIILTMSVFEDASRYCKSIEQELTSNQLLIDDFGPFYNPNDWTSSQFTVKGRQHNDPHATLEIFGTGSFSQKGHGCEMVVCDDIVTEENSITPEARRKMSSLFRMAIQTGPRPMWTIDPRYGLKVPQGMTWPKDAPYNPGRDQKYGLVDVSGTPFHPKDLYYDLKHDPSYATLHLDCWTDKDESKPLWGGFWTNEALHAERESLGLINFNKRYRCDPMDDSEIIFKREWFLGLGDHPGCVNRERSFGELPKDGEGVPLDLYKVLGFDPASGEVSKFAAWPTFDLLGFPVGGDPGEDKRYLLDIFRAQVGVEYLLDIMFDGNPAIPHPGFFATYQWDLCKVEKNGFANLLLTHQRVKDAEHRGLRIESHLTGRNKLDPVSGVKSMEAIFRDGLVDIPYKTDRDRKLADEFIDQFVYFAFDRSGRRKSLTDYVMAFWFAELALRKTKSNLKCITHGNSRFTIHNPAYSGQMRHTVHITRR